MTRRTRKSPPADTTDEEKLAALTQTARQAWERLDAAHRSMPDCEHNQAWERDIETAQAAHVKALRACDRQWARAQKARRAAGDGTEPAGSKEAVTATR